MNENQFIIWQIKKGLKTISLTIDGMIEELDMLFNNLNDKDSAKTNENAGMTNPEKVLNFIKSAGSKEKYYSMEELYSLFSEITKDELESIIEKLLKSGDIFEMDGKLKPV